MDKKFLNRVTNIIVNETEIDYHNYKIRFPSLYIFYRPFLTLSREHFLLIFEAFCDHCKNVYGLTEKESEYVWKEYRKIIKNKLRKGR